MSVMHPRLAHPRLAALATGLTLAGGSLAVALPGGASAAGARSAPPACQTSQLVVSLQPLRGGGTAGQTHETLLFSNIGGACTLHGYPGVSAVDHSGHQIGAAATKSGGGGRTVTLRAASAVSYSSASADVAFAVTEDIPASRCHGRLASGLRVYPPNQRASQYVPVAFPACAASGARVLQVTSIR